MNKWDDMEWEDGLNWMDGWTNGWMHACIDGWMDRQMDMDE